MSASPRSPEESAAAGGVAADPYERLDRVLERVAGAAAARPGPEVRDVFLELRPHALRQQAQALRAHARAGLPARPLEGLLVAVKDLFDVAGEVTRAGSRILADAPPAAADAEVVRQLRRSGALLLGRTNMSEFAFSGLGLNPHYGTPANPLQPGHAPGGSTSGGAVAVACGLADAALGTDTSGSVRIPAAWCGLVGWKPTKPRLSERGVFPLAPSLDSVGFIAADVATCIRLDRAVSLDRPPSLEPPALRGRRLGLPRELLQDLAEPVARAFDAALVRLRAAGVQTVEVGFEPARSLAPVVERGGFVGHEARGLHAARLAADAARLDPMVRRRLEAASGWRESDWQAALALRGVATRQADGLLEAFDALAMPATAIEAPTLASLVDPEAFDGANRAAIRNTMWANILGLCSLCLPIPSGAGVQSLMLFGRAGHDAALLALAAAVERVLGRC